MGPMKMGKIRESLLRTIEEKTSQEGSGPPMPCSLISSTQILKPIGLSGSQTFRKICHLMVFGKI